MNAMFRSLFASVARPSSHRALPKPAVLVPRHLTPAQLSGLRNAGSYVRRGDPRAQPTPKERSPFDPTLKPALDANDAVAVKESLERVNPRELYVPTSNRVLAVLANAGDLATMERHFAAMPRRDVISYSTVIKAYAQHGQLQRAADHLERMRELRAAKLAPEPDARLVAGVLKPLAESSVPRDGEKRLFSLLRESKWTKDPLAIKFFGDHLHHIDAVDGKLRYLQLMRSLGVQPDVTVYNMLIHAAGKAGDVEQAERHLEQMRLEGLEPTMHTYSSLIGCYGRAGRFERSFELAKEARSRGLWIGPDQYKALLSIARQARRADKIDELLREALKQLPSGTPPEELLNLAIAGAAECGDFDGVRRYLGEMQSRGRAPTVRTALLLAGAVNKAYPALRRRLTLAVTPGENAKLSSDDHHRALSAEEAAVLNEIVAQFPTGSSPDSPADSSPVADSPPSASAS